MDRYKAKETRGKSFSDLMTEKMVSGESTGSSLKSAISEKTKAKMMGIKDTFHPMNIAKKMTGGSSLGAAVVGKMIGASKEDMNYFTGNKKPKDSSVNNNSAIDLLGLIYQELVKANENKLKDLEDSKTKKKKESDDTSKQNQLIIEALTGRKTRKQKKAQRRKEKKVQKKVSGEPKQPPSSKLAQPKTTTTPSTGAKPTTTTTPSTVTPKPTTTTKLPSGAKPVTGGGAAATAVGGAAIAGGAIVTGGLLGMASKAIAAEEGLPKGGKAYYDPAGQKEKVSIGFGHQIKQDEYKQGFINIGGEQVPLKGDRGIDTVLSPSQAQTLLSQDLPIYEKRAKGPLGDSWDKLNDNQKTALMSYAYNTGSTKSLVDAGLKEAIDSGNTKEAAKIIREKGIRTAGGKENKALVKRRNNEANLFEEKEIKEPGESATTSKSLGAVDLKIQKPEEQKTASKSGGSNMLQYVKLKSSDVDIDGMQGQMKDSFAQMANEYFVANGKKIQVNSAFRSLKDQEELYRTKGPNLAAKPGSSLHNYGWAIDINSSDANRLNEMGLLKKFGFERPIAHEPWHLTKTGVSLAAAKQGIFSADAPKDQGATQVAQPAPNAPTTGTTIQTASVQNKEMKEALSKDKPTQIINNTSRNQNAQETASTQQFQADDTPAVLKKLQG